MYCTTDDLLKAQPTIRLIEATDDENPNEMGSFQVAIAQEMIDLACGVIDGYLASRLTLPLPMTPLIIKKIAVDLALHGLYERLGRAPDGSEMDTRRTNAIALLKEISKGTLTLGLPATEADAIDPPTSRTLIASGRAEFSMRSMASLGGGPWLDGRHP